MWLPANHYTQTHFISTQSGLRISNKFDFGLLVEPVCFGRFWVSHYEAPVRDCNLFIYLVWHHFGINATPKLHQFLILYQMLHWPQNGFREAENLKVLIYVNLILASLEGSQAVLRPSLGVKLQKKFLQYRVTAYLKYILLIFVTNKDVLLCFYFYR